MVSQQEAKSRWWMLLLLSLALLTLTLNWFDIAAGFPQLAQQFHLDVSQLTNLIASFLFGFALFHVPAGVLSYRIGVRNTLLLGLLLESLGGIACAFAFHYEALLVLRFLTGAGASLLIGMVLSLITSWFRGRELALAMGVSAGACFTLGMGIALFGWVSLIQAVGWSTAMSIGGVIGLVICVLCFVFLRVPSSEAQRLAAGNFSWEAVGRVLGNRDLWLVGLSFFGVYGAGLTIQQLLATYLGSVYHLPQSAGGLISAVYVLMSIPGAIVGGWLADRLPLRAMFVLPWLVFGAILPLALVGLWGVWMMGLIGGLCPQFGFTAWSAFPGRDHRVFPQDVSLAEGLLLTVGGAGGVIIPILFGQIAAHGGFSPAFLFGSVVSILFALVGFAAREPKSVPVTSPKDTGAMVEEHVAEEIHV